MLCWEPLRCLAWRCRDQMPLDCCHLLEAAPGDDAGHRPQMDDVSAPGRLAAKPLADVSARTRRARIQLRATHAQTTASKPGGRPPAAPRALRWAAWSAGVAMVVLM